MVFIVSEIQLLVLRHVVSYQNLICDHYTELGGGLLPQRFQTSRRGLLVSWLAQLAARVGEAGAGLASESEGGEGGGMVEGGSKEGDGTEMGGAMEVKVQRRRSAVVLGRLAVSEAGLGREGGDGGLLL